MNDLLNMRMQVEELLGLEPMRMPVKTAQSIRAEVHRTRNVIRLSFEPFFETFRRVRVRVRRRRRGRRGLRPMMRVKLGPRPGNSPGAVGLEQELVLSALDAEPTSFAPVLAPRVTHDPKPRTRGKNNRRITKDERRVVIISVA